LTQHSKQEVNWDFLLASSKTTLQAFEMSRLNMAANVRKEIVQLLDAWVNENSNALLARWLIERDLAADAKAICPNAGCRLGEPRQQPNEQQPPRMAHGAPKPPSRPAQLGAAQTQSASDKIFGEKPFTASRIHAAS
jgi:hypothetical protein